MPLMFMRRQAIRWAELWMSCWNDGDVDTLLTLYKDTRRFRTTDAHAATVAAFKRHWGALPFGIHSVRGELERVAWDPESRELTIVYTADLAGTRLYGCDLVTLDGDGHVLLGDPCVGGLADEDPGDVAPALVGAEHGFEGGR